MKTIIFLMLFSLTLLASQDCKPSYQKGFYLGWCTGIFINNGVDSSSAYKACDCSYQVLIEKYPNSIVDAPPSVQDQAIMLCAFSYLSKEEQDKIFIKESK